MFKLLKQALLPLLLFGTTLYIASDHLVGQLLASDQINTAKLSEDTRLKRRGETAARRIRDPFEQLKRAGSIESVKDHRIRPGQTLSTIWKHFGDSFQSAQSAHKALKAQEKRAATLRSGETLQLGLDSDGSIVALRRELDSLSSVVLVKTGGEFRSQMYQEPTRLLTVRREGQIEVSFAAAAKRADIPFEIVDEVVDLFSPQLDFKRQVRRGDRFVVVYRELRSRSGELLGVKELESAYYESGNTPLVAVRWQDSKGNVNYFDAAGEPMGNYFLRYPVRFSRISSAFSYSRLHPVLKIRRPHLGVDFAAPRGTAVRSVADGVVLSASYKGGAGKMIKIKHNSRYTTAYLHLSGYAKGVRSGHKVKRGQIIGYVGSTGLSTGPHLDYRIMKDGKYVNPLKIELPKLPKEFERIPDEMLESAVEKLKGSEAQLQFAAAERSSADA